MKTFYNVTLFCFALGLVILRFALDADAGGKSLLACGFGVRTGLVGEVFECAGRASGLERVCAVGGRSGIFFDCGWGFSVFLSGEARAGKGSGRIS
jgi:hypothetical protein